MERTHKICVAGFGHTSSVWFHFTESEFLAYTLETPKGRFTLPPDPWFVQHLLILRKNALHAPKTESKLIWFTLSAGERAVQALQDYNIYELALAFTSHYAWQVINGAKLLPTHKELARVIAGPFAIYAFRNEYEKQESEPVLLHAEHV